MKELILSLVFMIEAFAYVPEIPSSNVGTVLFSFSDFKRAHWKESDVALLEARRLFQRLVPPPHYSDPLNEEYIQGLLKYFRDAFTTVKKEAKDNSSHRILTKALSDAVGGYLKVWVIPVTKFAYYGGTISKESAVKVFDFYDDIKRYLDTDGNDWCTPNEDMLNTVTINVAPPPRISYVRSMDDPCEQLAYFEKSSTGLIVPIPYVNWDNQSSTMFIPLKNQSLISLNSLSSSNPLFKYYDIAKRCLQSTSPDALPDFDTKFQTWLALDIVPHLNDDRLYVGLNGVLGLVDKTKNLISHVANVYSTKFTNLCREIAGVPLNLNSKKMLIAILILILEIAWCVPAILYMIFSKKKKEKEEDDAPCLEFGLFKNVATGSSDSESDNDKKKKRKEKKDKAKKKAKRDANRKANNSEMKAVMALGSHDSNLETNNKKREYSNIQAPYKISNSSAQGLKYIQKSHLKSLEIQTVPTSSKHSMGTETSSFYNTKVCATEVTVINESPIISKQTSKKKKLTPIISSIDAYTVQPRAYSTSTLNGYEIHRQVRCCNIKPEPLKSSESSETWQELSSNKTVTLIKNNQSVESTAQIINKPTIDAENLEREYNQNPSTILNTTQCTCLSGLIENESSSPQNIESDTSKVTCAVSDRKKININRVAESIDVKDTVRRYKTGGMKLNSGKRYLEIKIDRPEAEISVGIGNLKPKSPIKRSRIPKRSLDFNVTEMPKSTKKFSPSSQCKSFIPQPQKRATDDSVLIRGANKTVWIKDSKLNISL